MNLDGYEVRTQSRSVGVSGHPPDDYTGGNVPSGVVVFIRFGNSGGCPPGTPGTNTNYSVLKQLEPQKGTAIPQSSGCWSNQGQRTGLAYRLMSGFSSIWLSARSSLVWVESFRLFITMLWSTCLVRKRRVLMFYVFHLCAMSTPGIQFTK